MPIYYNETTPTLANANIDALQVQARKVAGSTVPLTNLVELSKYVISQTKAADGAAANTTSEHVVYGSSLPCTITKAVYIPDAALTASDTNFGSIVVASRNSDGSTGATLSTTATRVTGGTGNWTAFVAVDLGISNVLLTANQSLTMAITKTGTGVVIPGGSFQIELTLS